MATPIVDGRTLRRERNLTAAVDAVLDLLAEGNPQPTAQDVADRSGLSIRSIFRLFDDMESLYATAVERQTERIRGLVQPVPKQGDVAARVAALVAARSRLFEAIAPVRRSGMRLAPSSPAIAAGLRRVDRAMRAEVRDLFDLADGPLLDAVDAATSFEAWDRLRTVQDLGRPRAEAAVALVLTRLVGR